MVATIQPSTISGVIKSPASKSAMQRACALALLHEGMTIIGNPGKSNDDLAAIEMIQILGATVAKREEDLVIQSGGVDPSESSINCGESGLGIRMFAPIAALSSKEITIHGEGSLLNRPMDFFDEIFPQLGVAIESNGGKLPIKIKGPLVPTDISIDGSLSSQFLTGLLIAFAKAAKEPVTISVADLKSKPYIDLTLAMMKDFGYEVENDNYEKFLIQPVLAPIAIGAARAFDSAHSTHLLSPPLRVVVEGDWSGAAFLLVAASIAGSVTVTGLDLSSAQADSAVLQALTMTGVCVSITEEDITVSSSSSALSLKPFHFNATHCPDLFPPLVALAAYCDGDSIIEGVSRLLHKESNRALTLQEEFGKMGVEIVLQDDLMVIKGTGEVKGTNVHSHHDHRIAMACAVAGLKANGNTIIEGAEAVNKSYPGFYEDLKMLGANVSLP